MKKFKMILLCLVIFSSCEKNVIGDFDGVAAEPFFPEEEIPQLSDAEKLKKRGIAYTNNKAAWSHKTHELAAHWMYSWGRELKEEIPENVEFVPMFWGKGSVNDTELAKIKQLIDEGKVKYVLGFNEPDGASQANMTVDEAIALWPKLEELGVPLGSPATVGPLNNWMKEFMQKAEELELRIDFVTVHSYGGPNVLSFLNMLKNTYKEYKKPIWITEFAVADWSASSAANNKHSEADVINFMSEALPVLDNLDWIHRYAWFDGFGRAPLAPSALFDADGKITALGEVYAEINPNTEIGPGQDTEFVVVADPNELIENGGFETGQKAPWKGYNNNVLNTSGGANTGNFFGRAGTDDKDGSFFTVAEVEPGKTYTLKYFARWSKPLTQDQPALSFVARNNNGNDLLFQFENKSPIADTWEEVTNEFEIPAGVTQLKIVFWKGATYPALFLDDVSLKLKE
ncbi:glycosyl hydrolase [Jejuia pallidilutea]|nr:glycosyl hydrolase [Jejuia pallidilutea]